MGSTPASTALLLFEIDTPLIHLKREIGTRPVPPQNLVHAN